MAGSRSRAPASAGLLGGVLSPNCLRRSGDGAINARQQESKQVSEFVHEGSECPIAEPARSRRHPEMLLDVESRNSHKGTSGQDRVLLRWVCDMNPSRPMNPGPKSLSTDIPCEGLSKSLGRRTYRSESPKSQFQSHEIVTHRASRNFPISFSFASFLNVFATFYHLLDGCARVWWLRLSIDCWCCRFRFITSEKRKIFAVNYSMMKCFLFWV